MRSAPKLQPVLLGSALIGALSGLPVVGLLNTCCCLWVVMGAAIALWISQSNHAYPVTAADGALIGLLAGFLGGIIAIPLDVLFEPTQRALSMRLLDWAQTVIPPDFRSALDDVRTMREQAIPPGLLIFNGLIRSVIFAIFGLGGGLLGVALFKKKDVPPGTTEVLPPSPPSNP